MRVRWVAILVHGTCHDYEVGAIRKAIGGEKLGGRLNDGFDGGTDMLPKPHVDDLPTLAFSDAKPLRERLIAAWVIAWHALCISANLAQFVNLISCQLAISVQVSASVLCWH